MVFIEYTDSKPFDFKNIMRYYRETALSTFHNRWIYFLVKLFTDNFRIYEINFYK